MSIDLNKFKNIIFDLGGVILNINYSLTTKAFLSLGFKNFDVLTLNSQQKELFDSFEKGKISAHDFRKEVNSFFKKDTDNSKIDTAWNAMLLDLPKERLALLEKLSTSHRIFLLSNTNEIHISAFNDYLKKNFEIGDFSSYFEKSYFSHLIKMRKPDAEIFEFVLSENNLLPQETLFIDDSIQNIEGAKKVGIQTYWLDIKKESILDILN